MLYNVRLVNTNVDLAIGSPEDVVPPELNRFLNFVISPGTTTNITEKTKQLVLSTG